MLADVTFGKQSGNDSLINRKVYLNKKDVLPTTAITNCSFAGKRIIVSEGNYERIRRGGMRLLKSGA